MIFLLKLGLATIPHAGFLSVSIKDKSVSDNLSG
jgi:hypothetical protein